MASCSLPCSGGVYGCSALLSQVLLPDFFDIIFFAPFCGVFVFPELAGQPFAGTATLTTSGCIAATGGTGPSGTGGPFSEGLSHGTNAESDECKALCFLAAGLASSLLSSSSESSKVGPTLCFCLLAWVLESPFYISVIKSWNQSGNILEAWKLWSSTKGSVLALFLQLLNGISEWFWSGAEALVLLLGRYTSFTCDAYQTKNIFPSRTVKQHLFSPKSLCWNCWTCWKAYCSKYASFSGGGWQQHYFQEEGLDIWVCRTSLIPKPPVSWSLGTNGSLLPEGEIAFSTIPPPSCLKAGCQSIMGGVFILVHQKISIWAIIMAGMWAWGWGWLRPPSRRNSRTRGRFSYYSHSTRRSSNYTSNNTALNHIVTRRSNWRINLCNIICTGIIMGSNSPGTGTGTLMKIMMVSCLGRCGWLGNFSFSNPIFNDYWLQKSHTGP